MALVLGFFFLSISNIHPVLPPLPDTKALSQPPKDDGRTREDPELSSHDGDFRGRTLHVFSPGQERGKRPREQRQDPGSWRSPG